MSRTEPYTKDSPATAATGKVVVSAQHLYKSFGANKVLDDFTLELSEGESVVVLGKSGSGKSVLIKCIIGLLQPDSGTIQLFGNPIIGLGENALDHLRAQVGFLFQSNALYDSMTVRENLEFPLRRHWIKISQDRIDNLVKSALEDVGLLSAIDMMPSELSGGMRKRIALARTLILQPKIILYDEPTTGLDPMTAKEIILLIRQIQRKYGTTSLIISHDLQCVRMAGDRIVVLYNGKCYADGSYAEISCLNDPFIKQFFDQLSWNNET